MDQDIARTMACYPPPEISVLDVLHHINEEFNPLQLSLAGNHCEIFTSSLTHLSYLLFRFFPGSENTTLILTGKKGGILNVYLVCFYAIFLLFSEEEVKEIYSDLSKVLLIPLSE